MPSVKEVFILNSTLGDGPLHIEQRTRFCRNHPPELRIGLVQKHPNPDQTRDYRIRRRRPNTHLHGEKVKHPHTHGVRRVLYHGFGHTVPGRPDQTGGPGCEFEELRKNDGEEETRGHFGGHGEPSY